MKIEDQSVIPAARSIKDFEMLLDMSFKYIIFLDVHIAQLVYLRRQARDFGKKLVLHADLVQGLQHDESAAQFLCQVIKPAGLISTHSKVIATAKKHDIMSIHRIFLIDSHSLETSYRVMKSSEPDYIEVLPGMMPRLVQEVAVAANRPVLAGGFIRTTEDVNTLLSHGAAAITTSSKDIWRKFRPD
ncbi:glycerol-3-phosphate responsive antiterminator [Alicyclobacillus sp. SO9]|uniref:glycerol-3-phosphate responsive antiterminator n=1 Tax=Alicyclobacillus sp. SO9 TaxID=2665646 RepID=UPI0018E785FE|nr:glycerol-3-phosphate responsive antiterminator [Alicyclobacillus sp. SO9]QQE77593.1 glycerol-3-phosphate responsive antiterminator [Alicyclobacillus sp. SO9]